MDFSHHFIVQPGVLFALLRAPMPLVSCLIVVGLSHQDESLDGDEQLQEVGVGRPGLCALAAPGAQQADTHLPVLVQVRVQPVRAVAVVVARRRGLDGGIKKINK